MRKEELVNIDEVVVGQNSKEKTYWLKKLAGIPGKSIFPYDFETPVKYRRMETVKFSITGEFFSKLMTIINGSDHRLHMFLVAALTVLLARHCREKRDNCIDIGTTIYNPEIEGKFINTLLVLRNSVNPDITFKDLLLTVRQTVMEALENQNYPLKALPYQLNIPFSEIDFPWFDTVLLLENIQDKSHLQPIKPALIFLFNRNEEYIKGEVEYDTHLYRPSTIERMISHLTNIIRQVVFNVHLPVTGIDIMTEEEKRQVLVDFNDTAAYYPREFTLHQLFETRVQETPDGAALQFQDRFLTYGVLNCQANRVAHLLQGRGMERGEIVGIMADKSFEMIAGLLGILKAGGAYLPIDPAYPEKRVLYMLEDSYTRFLLTYTETEEKKIPGFKGKILALQGEELHFQGVDNLPPITGPRDPAYVIYTSGSTGLPKGVLIEHRSVVAYTWSSKELIHLDSRDIRLQQSSFSFDQFVEELYPILAVGGKSIIVRKADIQDPERLGTIMAENHVTVFSTTPALLREIDKFSLPRSLRRILVGGDVLKEEDISNIIKKRPVDNFYGPTETTAAAAHYHYTGTVPTGIIPIGKPKSNYRIYILDEDEKPVPIGITGEIYISGEGVGRGYLNRPELTALTFIPDPFFPGPRMYRTGDLGRWLSDGNIEFAGRADHQVKIRGHRIEPGEIENQLVKHPAVKQAVVIEAEDQQLCAYIVLEPGDASTGITPVELIEYLSGRLPAYMIPVYMVPLEKIPITLNGKLDRKALPEPRGESDVQYTAPRDKIEEELVEIWAEILDRESETIGIDSNFFQVGGHSLKATLLVSKIHKKLNAKIPLTQVFKIPTVRAMAGYIRGAAQDRHRPIETVETREYYILSSAQKRLYILQCIEPQSIGYNIPMAAVMGVKPDRKRLENVFRQLIQRHESLRTSFHMVDGEPVQEIHDRLEFEIEHHTTEGDIAIQRFVRPFDLSQAPLLRVGIINARDNRPILIIDMHHIISDGTSMTLFIHELLLLYSGNPLAPLSIQYKDYAQWQNQEKKKEAVRQQEAYWLKEISGELPVLEIPLDFPRPAVRSFTGAELRFKLDREETAALKKMALSGDVTLFMLLLAITNVLLMRLTGQEDILVGTPIAGRRHSDLQKIIGMFLNTLVMRNRPSVNKTFAVFLKEVKTKTSEAFENQDYPFEELVDQAAVNRDTARNPLFDVLFTLQNIEMQDIEKSQLRLKPYLHENKISKFDLTILATEEGENLVFIMGYSTNLFKPGTITRFFGYLKAITAAVTRNPHQKLSGIEILPADEKKMILEEFNNTDAPLPAVQTVHGLFEEQVERTPDHTAVIGTREPQESGGHSPGGAGLVSITYKELNEKSNQLARLVRAKGIKPGALIAIVPGRTVGLMVGILGILKAGGAYLPIDPGYPADRISYILADSAAKILVTTKALAEESERVKKYEGEKIYLENLNKPSRSPGAKEQPPASPRGLAADFAYVAYTSGSTGKPKGVMVSHLSVVNFITGLTRVIDIHGNDRILSLTTVSFDIFGLETLLPLTAGPTVVIGTQEEQLDAAAAAAVIKREKITIFQVTPSRLQLFVTRQEAGASLKNLRYLLVGGEAFPQQLLEKARELTRGKIYNLYGPTETTIWSTLKEVTTGESLNIGKPLVNTRIYILDSLGGIQPIGVAGELWIAGAGVARGYSNQPELTARKFIELEVKVNMSHITHMSYKTGDLARWLPDGSIEFLGRTDRQVKIRGFRIELAEIENQLHQHHSIKEAVAAVKEKEHNRLLYAYIVFKPSTGPGTPTVSQLREYLAGKLPGYMIPSGFVSVETIPLTPHGKVDVKSLPEPGKLRPHLGSAFVLPGTEMEKIVCTAWKEVLKLEKLGIHDNFFDLGGNSLSLISLNNRLQETLKRDIPVLKMFEHPTISSLCRYLERDGSMSPGRSRQDKVPGKGMQEVVLNKAQNRMKKTFQKIRHN